MFYLVNDSKNRVQNELVEALYKENLFAELLEEGPQVAARRQVRLLRKKGKGDTHFFFSRLAPRCWMC